jgi:hypothetical protein
MDRIVETTKALGCEYILCYSHISLACSPRAASAMLQKRLSWRTRVLLFSPPSSMISYRQNKRLFCAGYAFTTTYSLLILLSSISALEIPSAMRRRATKVGFWARLFAGGGGREKWASFIVPYSHAIT